MSKHIRHCINCFACVTKNHPDCFALPPSSDNWEDDIRKICTYYSELGEGTAGYDLSEEKFQKLFALIRQVRERERETLRKYAVAENEKYLKDNSR